ncbi:hypothetical protein [Aureimonas psammosilenae]|uniref:hypothetical protein n=1 Tax=Aureimonas psammosilenae TaxID=2495496 RepID=UPI001260BF7F|nr:hypothetical protein [Aureimonas psammosilenae]
MRLIAKLSAKRGDREALMRRLERLALERREDGRLGRLPASSMLRQNDGGGSASLTLSRSGSVGAEID